MLLKCNLDVLYWVVWDYSFSRYMCVYVYVCMNTHILNNWTIIDIIYPRNVKINIFSNNMPMYTYLGKLTWGIMVYLVPDNSSIFSYYSGEKIINLNKILMFDVIDCLTTVLSNSWKFYFTQKVLYNFVNLFMDCSEDFH